MKLPIDKRSIFITSRKNYSRFISNCLYHKQRIGSKENSSFGQGTVSGIKTIKQDRYLVKIAILFWRTGWDSPPAGGPGLGSDSPPGCHSLPRPSNPTLFHDKTIPAQKGRDRFMADRVGFDLRCGGGRVAGKTCPRHVFLHRSRSNPLQVFQKEKHPKRGAFPFGGQGGIRTHEPLARLPDFESGPL